MWKSGFCLTATGIFYPQAYVDEREVFHTPMWRRFLLGVFHRIFFHIPQALWKKLEAHYRQELMFAVMSRMLFSSVVSPFFSWVSTLRIL